MSDIGIVTALAGEARALSRQPRDIPYEAAPGFTAMVSGIGAERARTAARILLDKKEVKGLISWGTAAGLDPALSCGTLLLPEAILSDSTVLPVHASWQQQAAERLHWLKPLLPRLADSPALLTTSEAKRELRHQTGAAAADMESAAIARVARDKKVPFLCVRVIIDTANETIPPVLPGLLDQNGRLRFPALLQTLLLQPALLLDLCRLGRRFNRASQRLRAVARNMDALELPET